MKLFSLRMLSMATFLSSVLVVGAQSVQALSISVSSDAQTFTCADGAGCDLDPATGVVLSNTNLGGLAISINTTGTGNPALGSQSFPDIDLNSVLTTNFSGPDRTFTLRVSDTGFTGPFSSGPQPFELHIGGTRAVGATVTSTLYLDSNNVLFGTQNNVTSLFFPAPLSSAQQSFSNDAAGSANSGTPYSLTLETVITHSGGARRTTSFDAEAHAVPEPSSLLLLGSGLIGLGWLRRKQKNS